MSPFEGSDLGAGAEAATPIGVARLSKLAFDGADLKSVWRGLIDKFVAGTDEAAALMDLATLEQLLGNPEGGVICQSAALDRLRLYRSPCSAAQPSLRLLALAAPGDIGVNTPLEFLLEDSDIALDTLFIAPGLAPPVTLPEFDLAIVTVGESERNRPVLDEIARLVASWRAPVLNDPARIAQLSRDRVPTLLAGAPGLVVPPTRRIERDGLARLAAGTTTAAALIPGAAAPFIVRPVDSHAGRGLARIDDRVALARYLRERPEAQFFVAPFVDYGSADGSYRKFRIAFVGGRPYACHMAIAEQWMIYYLNAGMRESAQKRAEEARFMADFDDDFAKRHGDALQAIAERIALDYFAIDCAETRDGRLLFFEADVAMIVHDMDPPDLFPYKGPQMRKVFDAFQALLRRRADGVT